MITRKPKLRRQRKIFRQQGKLPRPDQMNINAAAWGRLLRRNFFFQKSGDISEGGPRLEKQSSTTGNILLIQLFIQFQNKIHIIFQYTLRIYNIFLARFLSTTKSFKF